MISLNAGSHFSMVRSLKVVSKWSQSVSNGDICGLKGVSKCWQCCHLESQRSFKVLAALASGVSTGSQSSGSGGIWRFKAVKALAAFASGVSKGSQGGFKVLAVVRRGSGSFV